MGAIDQGRMRINNHSATSGIPGVGHVRIRSHLLGARDVATTPGQLSVPSGPVVASGARNQLLPSHPEETVSWLEFLQGVLSEVA